MTGNIGSNPGEPLFLLDESLTPVVAEALILVGYNFATVAAEFGRQGVQDPEIIEWCREREAVWVHADVRALREHRALLQTSGIRTILIERPRNGMAIEEQLRVLSFVLPRYFENIQRRPGDRHFRTTAAKPTSAPSFRPVRI